MILQDFQASSLDPDKGPGHKRGKGSKKDNADEEDEDDESYPLLKETNLGGTPGGPKALKRQCR